MQNLLEMGVKSHKAWLKSEFYHICLSVYLCTTDVWSRSSFWVTLCRLPQCWCKTIDYVLKFYFLQTNIVIKLTFVANFGFIHKIWGRIIDLNDISDSKWHAKCPRNFRPPPWILLKIFIFYTVIPSSKQKHATGSLTHTHDQQQLQTKSNWARHISC